MSKNPCSPRNISKITLTVTPREKDKVTVAGKELTLRKVTITDDQIDLAQFATDNNFDPNSCLFFGYTNIIAPDEIKNVKLATGSDDSSVWWLNGEEVIRVYMGRAVNPDDTPSKVITLKKGVNILASPSSRATAPPAPSPASSTPPTNPSPPSKSPPTPRNASPAVPR